MILLVTNIPGNYIDTNIFQLGFIMISFTFSLPIVKFKMIFA